MIKIYIKYVNNKKENRNLKLYQGDISDTQQILKLHMYPQDKLSKRYYQYYMRLSLQGTAYKWIRPLLNKFLQGKEYNL